MANCRICGKPVLTATVRHAACWEREAERLAEEFCDGYCRWMRECTEEDELEEKCSKCPLEKMIRLGM